MLQFQGTFHPKIIKHRVFNNNQDGQMQNVDIFHILEDTYNLDSSSWKTEIDWQPVPSLYAAFNTSIAASSQSKFLSSKTQYTNM